MQSQALSHDHVDQKLVQFIRRYHNEFEKRLSATIRDNLIHHREKAELISVIKGSDGFAVFYLPKPPPDQHAVPLGIHAFDYSEYSLNRICQSLSVNRLKVASTELGNLWDETPLPPADLPAIPDLAGPLIHADLRRAAIEGRLNLLPGMTVRPVVRLEDGILREIVPCRVRLWSPVFEFPSLGLRRLFLWPYADLWWMPEALDLSPDAAIQTAKNDLIALSTFLAAHENQQIGPRDAEKDTSETAAGLLEQKCVDFEGLLDAKGAEEETIHQWLYRRSNWPFLDTSARNVRSKVVFGDKVSDFVVERADGTYHLIEIEAATLQIFQSGSHEPTARFNHARQQIKDWRRYIRDNAQTVSRELGLTDIYEPSGTVVAGRSSMIQHSEARKRWRDLKAENIGVFTYDELTERVRALAVSLRQTIQPSA